MQHNHYHNESQDLLNRNVRGIFIFVHLLFSMVVYTPLWLYGFYLERKIFGIQYKGLKELLIVVGLSVLMYWIIYFLKGLLISLQERENSFWIVLVILYMGLFVGVPVWFYFVAFKVSANPYINIVIGGLIVTSIYSHYKFHKPGATILGQTGYSLGRWFGKKI